MLRWHGGCLFRISRGRDWLGGWHFAAGRVVVIGGAPDCVLEGSVRSFFVFFLVLLCLLAA